MHPTRCLNKKDLEGWPVGFEISEYGVIVNAVSLILPPLFSTVAKHFSSLHGSSRLLPRKITEKKYFVTATKVGTTNNFFVAATKTFAAATKRFVGRTKHFDVVTKYFCHLNFNKWFCWYKKPFFRVFLKIPLRLTISMESSRQDLANDIVVVGFI